MARVNFSNVMGNILWTYIWFHSSVGSLMDVEVRLLVETLVAVRNRTLVTLLAALGVARFFLKTGLCELQLRLLS